MICPSELRRGNLGSLLEQGGEVLRILEVKAVADVLDGQVGTTQQLLGTMNAQVDEILHGR